MAFKLKNESVKKIIGELRKASKTHAGQADRLEKIMISSSAFIITTLIGIVVALVIKLN